MESLRNIELLFFYVLFAVLDRESELEPHKLDKFWDTPQHKMVLFKYNFSFSFEIIIKLHHFFFPYLPLNSIM